jgi:hypothetical protein
MSDQPVGEYPDTAALMNIAQAVSHMRDVALKGHRELQAECNRLREENITLGAQNVALGAQLDVAKADAATWRALATGRTQCA